MYLSGMVLALFRTISCTLGTGKELPKPNPSSSCSVPILRNCNCSSKMRYLFIQFTGNLVPDHNGDAHDSWLVSCFWLHLVTL